MLDSVPAYIQSNLSFFSILLCGAIAAFVSYFLYRRSVPPLPFIWLIFLAAIRGIVVALILILLFAPEISFVWQRKIPVKIGIALDRSGSMTLDNKMEIANEITNDLHAAFAQKAELKIYAFDIDTATVENENIIAGDRGTDIASSLSKIAQSEFNPDALIMVSDGNFTTGQNPIYTSTANRLRIYTIGVGDTAFAPDLLISDVQINKIVYQNKPTTIQAEIQLFGLNEARSNVVLFQNDKKVDVKQIRIDQREITVPVKFELTPAKIGLVRYRLRVEPLGEEKNTLNNDFSFSLNVLKGQLQIGIVAQKPSLDFKFLKLILDNREDLKTNLYLSPPLLPSASRSSPFLPDSMDLLIFFNSPPNKIQERLASAFSRKPIPLIFFLTEPVGPADIKFLKLFIPITAVQSEVKNGEYLVRRTGAGRLWPVLNNYAEDVTNNMFWAKCPPIYYPFKGIELDDAGTIIVETQAVTPEPVMYQYMKAGLRGIVFFGSGFWRWHFLLAEDRQFQHAWSEKIYNITRWLTSGAAYSNVVLTTHKNDFQTGEPIRLNVQVYDGAFKPVTDATVRLRVSGAGQNYEVEAELTENSIYQGNIPSPGKGNFMIEAQAWRNDVNIGIASKEIYISPVNSEYLSSRQDYRFLKSLAKVSGAEYATADSFRSILSQIDLTPRIRRIERNFELWYRLPVLMVILSLFTAEWFVRKRKGLA